MTAPALSVVIPVYNAAGCVRELYTRLVAVLQATATSFELVLVDDSSTDDSWPLVRQIAIADPRVHAIQLSRNFGQHAAITAGISAARGESIIVMDCDLQDQPEEIPKLQAAAKDGVDIVFARRKNRSDSAMRRFSSRAALGLVGLLSGAKIDPEIGSFSLIRRRVADEYLRVADQHSHFLQVLRWLGFTQQTVDVVEAPRFAGRTAYTLPKLVRHFWNGMVAQSERLLHVAVYLGFLFGLFAAIEIIVLVVRALFFGFGVPGWASIMVAIFLVGGAVLFSLGVLGLYIGKIYEQGQRRPRFVIRADITGTHEQRQPESDSVERRTASW